MACPTGVRKVESKDPRINYNLLPGEKLLTCPYNESHALLPIKFAKHVLNCHRRHCDEQKKKNAQPLFAICQYDRTHHVRKEEIEAHESSCKAREDAWESEEEDNGNSSSFMKSEGSSKADKIVVVLQTPPPIDAESLKAMESTEDWSLEESHSEFNPEAFKHHQRMSGKTIIDTQGLVGLSKSEKKEYYKKEEEKTKFYKEVKERKELQSTARGRGRGRFINPTKKTTIFGYTLDTLPEEEEDN